VLLRSERILTPLGTIAGYISVREGLIEAVGPGRGALGETGPGGGALGETGPGGGDLGQALDLGRRWLVPGYIDTHVHGGAGAQCNSSDASEIAAVARFHAAHGTTGLLATLVPAPVSDLAAAVESVARCRSPRGDGAAVLGVHLEGPVLNPLRAGALDPGACVPADQGVMVLERLLAAGGVRMVTLSPELAGALRLVEALVARRVIVSLGHSDATYAQARAAVAAGARSATHLFNAMRPFHHREPGVLGAALDLPDVNCELICDGIHVDPAALRLAVSAKGPSGVRLITDATAAAGLEDGEYRLGAATFSVASGGALAGSALTMDEAVRNAVRFLDLPVEQAVGLASANPARLLGLDARKGALAAGFDADIAVLDDDLRAVATMVGGRWVHSI